MQTWRTLKKKINESLLTDADDAATSEKHALDRFKLGKQAVAVFGQWYNFRSSISIRWYTPHLRLCNNDMLTWTSVDRSFLPAVSETSNSLSKNTGGVALSAHVQNLPLVIILITAEGSESWSRVSAAKSSWCRLITLIESRSMPI